MTNKTRKVRASQAGMTLVELMLACGVVAVSLSLLFGAMTGFGNVGTLSSDRSQAMVALAGTVEQLRFMDYSKVLTFEPEKMETGPGASRALTIEYFDASGDAHTLPVEGTPPTNLPNPLELRARMVWQDKAGRAYTAVVSTKVPR